MKAIAPLDPSITGASESESRFQMINDRQFSKGKGEKFSNERNKVNAEKMNHPKPIEYSKTFKKFPGWLHLYSKEYKVRGKSTVPVLELGKFVISRIECPDQPWPTI
jgi:hypothetical protein